MRRGCGEQLAEFRFWFETRIRSARRLLLFEIREAL